jgi:hypothetical protein
MAPAIMIAVSRSGNNNPWSYIVTPDRGERPVPTTRLARIASLDSQKTGNAPVAGVRRTDILTDLLDAKPVPILQNPFLF